MDSFKLYLGTIVFSVGLILNARLVVQSCYAEGARLTPAQMNALPDAGRVLGWETNMNQVYARKMNRELQQPSPMPDSPSVIYFENRQNQPVSEQDFLMNTPRPSR